MDDTIPSKLGYTAEHIIRYFDAVLQKETTNKFATADIIIDGESNILEAGETIIMPANIPHALKAAEKFKMVLTMIRPK